MVSHYPLKPIGDFVQLSQGYKFLREHFAEEGIPLIKIGNITHGRLELNNVTYVDESYRDPLAEHFANTGEILMAITGSGPSSPNSAVGKVARYMEAPELYFVNQRVARFKCIDESKLDMSYLYFLMLRSHFIDELRRGAGGTGQASIRFDQITSYKIPIPPLEEQKKLSFLLDRVTDRVDLSYRIIDTLNLVVARVTEDALTKGISEIESSMPEAVNG